MYIVAYDKATSIEKICESEETKNDGTGYRPI